MRAHFFHVVSKIYICKSMIQKVKIYSIQINLHINKYIICISKNKLLIYVNY